MGAEYEKCHRSILGWGSYAQIGPNLTAYFGLTGVVVGDAAARFSIPQNCTIMNMHVYLEQFPGAGEQIQITTFINGVPGNLDVTILGAAARAGADLVNNDALVQGDQINIRCINSLNAATNRVSVTFEVRT